MTSRHEKLVRRLAVGAMASAVAFVPLGASMASAGATKANTAECNQDQLPVPGRLIGHAIGGDPTGRYIVGYRGWLSDEEHSALLWVDGEPQTLTGPVPDPYYVQGLDVNGSGVVIGLSQSQEGARYAGWKYADGEYTVLPAPAEAQNVWVSGINAAGDIVGHADMPDGDVALFWPADERDTFLQLKAPTSARTSDISDTGVITGGLENDEGDVVSGYLWTDVDNEGSRLRDPAGGVDTLASAISANGKWVVGSHHVGGGAAAVWNLEDGTIKEYPDHYDSGNDSFGTGFGNVNNSGDASRSYYLGEDIDYPYSVIVRADGTANAITGYIGVLFDRGAEFTAAGWDYGISPDDEVPVIWRGC